MKQHTQYELIILDRDGVINEDSKEYIKSPDEWHAIPGSLPAIAKLNAAGFKVAIATNQSGISRGCFTTKILQDIHKKMLQELAEFDGHIDDIIYCPHHPKDNCNCRKPQPGMLLKILAKFNIKPEKTLLIGDSLKDSQAANAAGCQSFLVKTGKEKEADQKHAKEINVPIFTDLAAAVDTIIAYNQ